MADNSRMVNVLLIPAALFNDAGQRLSAGAWSPLYNRMRTLIDDSLRAVLLSVHLNTDCYLELMLDHSVDLRPDKARDLLEEQLRKLRSEASNKIAMAPSNPWWDRVRLQMDNMINELYRNTRTGVENDCVVANCWLPMVASHNLVASGEIAFTSASGFSGTVAQAETPKGPQSLEQLLLTPRDLEITTNPDLGLLLQGLATEVNDQNRGMPFKFRIRMEGNDLLKQGITQNQRPGNFSLAAQPLAEILTEIMFRANSNKTASGPNDPLCELVWIVADDPEQPGQKMVLVTTRTAVTEKNLVLPPQFRVDTESGQ
jgi:hypothetical protein